MNTASGDERKGVSRKGLTLGGTRSDRAGKLESPVVAAHDVAGGYSKSHSPERVKPTLRHMAFDGRLSTDGNAWMEWCFPSALAFSKATAVARAAMPWPWNSGRTLHPISHTVSPCHSRPQ
jgi:hypothetical protein